MQPIEFVLDGSDGEAVGIEYNRVTLERDGEEKNKKSETCSSFTINFQRQHRWPTVMVILCVKEFRWEEMLKTK